MKKAFSIAVGLAFLLVCMPAMAGDTTQALVNGPGYSMGYTSGYTYDLNTAEYELQADVAYGITPYRYEGKSQSKASLIYSGNGVQIDNVNKTKNAPTFAAGQATYTSHTSNKKATKAFDTVYTAGSDVDTNGKAKYYLQSFSFMNDYEKDNVSYTDTPTVRSYVEIDYAKIGHVFVWADDNNGNYDDWEWWGKVKKSQNKNGWANSWVEDQGGQVDVGVDHKRLN